LNTKTTSSDLEYYLGKLQPEYESRGQTKIGRMLDEYSIAFYYKDPILVWENGDRRIKRPDFTLPTYNNTVIQYIPVPDEAAKQNSRVYRENNIAALFIKDSNMAESNWKQELYEKLEEIYHQPHIFSADRYQPL
jgi:hypothetical protein